jgi:hypothetical protein
MTTGRIDCSGLVLTELSFWRWLGVEVPYYDQALVAVSTDSVHWTTVWENPYEITDSEWTHMDLDISAIADDEESVYLRWTMGPTDLTNNYCGWNIDDVEILAHDLIPPEIEEPVSALRMSPAWPNPFRDQTVLRFALPAPGIVRVRIYNVAGRLVRELPAVHCDAGPNERTWDGGDSGGNRVASGVYFVRVSAGDATADGKVVLLR